MLAKLGVWVKAAGTMPPAQVLARACAKLGIRTRALRRMDLLASPDLRRPLRSAEILDKALASAKLSSAKLWRLADGARVVEVGCGQLGGVGPAMLTSGARQYVGIDPGIDVELFEDRRVLDGFFASALDSAAAHFARSPKVSLEQFQDRTRFVDETLECYSAESGSVDLFVSVSCLEHIGDLNRAVEVMAKLGREDARHVHIVNFSNHTSKPRPFAGLYEMPRDDYVRRWGGHINGLRYSDLTRIFDAHGVTVQFVPTDVRLDALPADIDPMWLDTYERDELAVRAGLLVSPELSV